MSDLQAIPGLIQRIDASADELDRLALEIAEHGAAESASAYAALWRDIHDSAESAGLDGLSEITEFVWFNTQRLADGCGHSQLNPEQLETLHGVVPVLSVSGNAPGRRRAR